MTHLKIEGATRYNVNNYVHSLLKIEAFKNTYKYQYYLVSDNFLPLVLKSAGRPQTKRKRKAGEERSFQRSCNVKCSNCDEWGHNITTCKTPKGSKSIKKLVLSSTHVTYFPL